MGVHGSEVVHAIRAALRGEVDDPFVISPQAPTQSEIKVTPNPDKTWANRDGTLSFDCIGRDYFRAFRIIVEVLPSVDDFNAS